MSCSRTIDFYLLNTAEPQTLKFDVIKQNHRHLNAKLSGALYNNGKFKKYVPLKTSAIRKIFLAFYQFFVTNQQGGYLKDCTLQHSGRMLQMSSKGVQGSGTASTDDTGGKKIAEKGFQIINSSLNQKKKILKLLRGSQKILRIL